MPLRNIPIGRKLTGVILLTSVVVMVLMGGAFFVYEFRTFRQNTVTQLSSLGEITAANSTAALAFEDRGDATEILAALAAQRQIVAASLYRQDGLIFARYPEHSPDASFPSAPGPTGYHFENSSLVGFQPVVQSNKRLGTLYLRFDTGAIMAEWLRVSLGIGGAVTAVVLLVAYALSQVLQRQISRPILSLAETAKAVSTDNDYSVRAVKYGADELGLLTDAFNQMLTQIERQNLALRGSEAQLERRVLERTAQLATANAELEQSRAKLNSLFESLPGLYLVLTPDLKILAASDAYLTATLTTREGIIGRDLFEVFPDNPDDPTANGASNLRASLERVRQKAAPDIMAIQKYDLRRPDGVFEEHYWSPINSPVVGANRQVEYIIHRVEDVTDFVRHKPQAAGHANELQARMERMEAEIYQSAQKVQASNQQLQAANQELESFSYSISHDLRAPLRHIDGFAGLLTKHASASLDEKGRRYLATISDSAKRLGQLIDELLVFSRMGRTELRQTPFESRAMIDEVIRELQPDLQGRQVEWRIGDLPRVQADPAMLRQVWANLLGNAVKYTRNRPVARIEIEQQQNGTKEIVFAVRDNGAGFDMQYASKLFGVFQRLHTASEFEGTGIGLANVHRIIQRHGGRVWAEGTVGEGATFYFSLPANTTSSATTSANNPQSSARS